MATDCPKSEIVVPGQPEIVDGAVVNIVKRKIVQARLGASCLERFLDVIHWFPSPKENPARLILLGNRERASHTPEWSGTERATPVFVLSPFKRMNLFWRPTSSQVRKRNSDCLMPMYYGTSAKVNHAASSRMTRYRSDFPSKPMPGSSGIVM